MSVSSRPTVAEASGGGLVYADGRYRKVILPDFPSNLVTVKFILGTPAHVPKSDKEGAAARSRTMKDVIKEMKEHDDMIMLDVRLRIQSSTTRI